MKRLVQTINKLDPIEVEKLVLIDFNGHYVFGDAPIHQELQSLITTPIPIEYVPYHFNPAYVINKIAGLKGLIGMRLHSAVFGYLTKTPTIIFSYHPKCDGWAEQIGASPAFTIDSKKFQPEELLHAVNRLLDGTFEEPTVSIEAAKHYAMKNWEGAKCALFPL